MQLMLFIPPSLHSSVITCPPSLESREQLGIRDHDVTVFVWWCERIELACSPTATYLEYLSGYMPWFVLSPRRSDAPLLPPAQHIPFPSPFSTPLSSSTYSILATFARIIPVSLSENLFSDSPTEIFFTSLFCFWDTPPGPSTASRDDRTLFTASAPLSISPQAQVEEVGGLQSLMRLVSPCMVSTSCPFLISSLNVI